LFIIWKFNLLQCALSGKILENRVIELIVGLQNKKHWFASYGEKKMIIGI